MLMVDPWHWLDENGEIPEGPPRLRKNLISVLRVIEYGSLLEPGMSRETLIECRRRPQSARCPGLLRVVKNDDDLLYAYCPECGSDEMLISNWQDTPWADDPLF